LSIGSGLAEGAAVGILPVATHAESGKRQRADKAVSMLVSRPLLAGPGRDPDGNLLLFAWATGVRPDRVARDSPPATAGLPQNVRPVGAKSR
jgi:hypothetical protein